MLERLYIENVAVIERAEIEFYEGLNILTGETGAGKSIIIDSLGMLLGQRASKDLVRTGCSYAYVAGRFALSGAAVHAKLDELDVRPEDDGTLFIERRFTAEGKSTARIGGRPVPLTALRELAAYLVVIHGQHLNQRILDPASHIGYLDGYLGADPAMAEYAAQYRLTQAARRELLRLQRLEKEKQEKLDMLQFRIDELTRANLSDGEEEALTVRRDAAAGAEKLRTAIRSARGLLYDMEGSACERLTAASAALGAASEYSARLRELGARLDALAAEAESVSDDLREVGAAVDDAGSLDEIEQRLAELKRIRRKYGGSIAAAMQLLESSLRERDEFEGVSQRVAEQAAEFERLALLLAERAAALTSARRAAGNRLAAAVMEKLAFLDMDKCIFEIRIEKSEKFTANGRDTVEFFLSANPGESPKPLAKIASGGELSRIMLAIVSVLSEGDPADTVIFDEVDSGVSGKTAQKIGVLLKAAAARPQVLCVTHLAQIAAMADRHLLITKQSDADRTTTTVRALDEQGRREELARILGGMQITDAALQAADALIAEGRKQTERFR